MSERACGRYLQMVPGTEQVAGMTLVGHLMAGSVCRTCQIQNTELCIPVFLCIPLKKRRCKEKKGSGPLPRCAFYS